MSKLNQDLSLEIVRGVDANKIEFSAIVLCSLKEAEKIKSNSESQDLSNMKIIYQTKGYIIDEDIIKAITSYFSSDTFPESDFSSDQLMGDNFNNDLIDCYD